MASISPSREVMAAQLDAMTLSLRDARAERDLLRLENAALRSQNQRLRAGLRAGDELAEWMANAEARS